MAKYNIFATRADWENFYEEVEKAGFGKYLGHFKKSQSLDMSKVDLDILKRRAKPEEARQ